jgi:hypothetical protein
MLPELHITVASLPFAAFTRLDQHYSGYLHQAFYQGGRVSIESNLFCYAKNGVSKDTNNGYRYY